MLQTVELTKVNCAITQSQLVAVTGNPKCGQKLHAQIVISFWFVSHGLNTWHKSFNSIAKRSNGVITCDGQFEKCSIALCILTWSLNLKGTKMCAACA